MEDDFISVEGDQEGIVTKGANFHISLLKNISMEGDRHIKILLESDPDVEEIIYFSSDRLCRRTFERISASWSIFKGRKE